MNKRVLISICIPTFNRKELIQSLLFQLNKITNFFFEVIVVNDGSTDGTKEFLETNAGTLSYPLQVFHQENTGRASALRKAVLAANGEYIIIMDDDDRFILDSLEQVVTDIKNDVQTINAEREIAGLVYLANTISDNTLVGTRFPEENLVSNLLEIRADLDVLGDKKEVIRREILQAIMYTVPNDERRMPTSVLWARVAKKYDVICKNRALIQKQYLSEGLSKNIIKNRVENPAGAMMGYFEVITSPKDVFKSKIYMMRNSINYFRFYFHMKNRFSIFYFFFAGSLGWLASMYDRLIIKLKK